jgi:hypothetical protein
MESYDYVNKENPSFTAHGYFIATNNVDNHRGESGHLYDRPPVLSFSLLTFDISLYDSILPFVRRFLQNSRLRPEWVIKKGDIEVGRVDDGAYQQHLRLSIFLSILGRGGCVASRALELSFPRQGKKSWPPRKPR